MFVDRIKIFVQGGRGGDGCVSFRREKYVPRGGPNGGDGGHGGSVIVRAEPGVNNLADISSRKHWRAANGERGLGSDCHGRNAEDVILRVPPGTMIVDAEEGFVLKDLVEAEDQVTVARGGRGGKGNTHFKSATNQVPRQSTPGEEGEQREIVLELKVIADVGLLGKPNAGKSTLLSRVSRARPEIADYPFTTKYPNLGLVRLDQDRSFVLADIPGLIEGAHAGIGLGHDFLRHIERAGILIHLVEPDPMDGSDPLTNYNSIHDELGKYNSLLLSRPEIVVVSKCELPGAEEVRAHLAQELGRDVLAISAVTGQGLNELLRLVAERLEEQRPEPFAPKPWTPGS